MFFVRSLGSILHHAYVHETVILYRVNSEFVRTRYKLKLQYNSIIILCVCVLNARARLK